MSFKRYLTRTITASLMIGLIAAVGFVSPAKAASCFTVDSTGAGVTSSTPVFNNICNAPYSIGSEADFVRIRQSSNGNNQDNVNNPHYTNSISSTCTDGTKFDVWNYIHNDASQDLNNNGTGSAVAHNVNLAMTAPLGTTAANFTFGATVSASNAASVSDTATLTCDNGKQVKLTMVPSTVHLYNSQYGWKILPDGSVNGNTQIGSPTFGSGDVWGCWDYRVVVVYTVTVTEVPVTPPKAVGTCDLFHAIGSDNRKATVDQFKFSVTNATLSKTVIAWGENNSETTVTDATKVVGQNHSYSADGTYRIIATLTFAGTNGATAPSTVTCSSDVTFGSSKPPVVPPKELPKTGAGSLVGLFAGISAAGAVAYNLVARRRASNN